MSKIDLFTTREDSREFDPDVIHRASCNADAPYTQKTCKTYPWAAAARIRYLENKLQEFEDRGELLRLYCPVCRKYRGGASHICVNPDRKEAP